ncbi:MAG: hypothetical protein HYY93_06350 [Planctomycetes bacterium]|nr:hypothetical protein [Planctomycetota bacterium]
MKIFPPGLAALMALALLPAGAADVVTLRNGSRFEGQVTESGDRVSVRVDSGCLSFPRSSVAGIERRASPLDVLAERRASLAPGDAPGHYALGCWARREGLTAAAREEFEAVIESDPDHAGAREALGFRLVEGRWLTEEEWRAGQPGLSESQGGASGREPADRAEPSELETLRAEIRLLREQMAALAEESRVALATATAENRRLQTENLNLAASSSTFAAMVIRLQEELTLRRGCSSFYLPAPIDIADPRLQLAGSRLTVLAPTPPPHCCPDECSGDTK